MQKKIIALAVAGLVSGAAFAQSNVTIYGVADAGQAWVKHSGPGADQNTVGRLDSNSSYIGFKGSEDLGNGLKAIFQIENGVNLDNGAAGAWNSRDSYVGLTGGFGTLVMGNLTHPLRAMGSKVDNLPGAAGIGTMNSLTGVIQAGAATAQTGADNRAANAAAYVSPNFMGFTVTGAYVNGETEPNAVGSGEAKQYQIAAQYENGPMYVGFGYHAADNIGGVSASDADIWRLAAQYKFDFGTTVNFMYDSTDFDTGAAVAGSRDRNAWQLGANHTMGAHNIGLQYADAGKTDNVANSESSMWTLHYGYSLSKRTMVLARYSKISNDSGASYNFYNGAVANPTVLTAGNDVTGYMVNLRHSF